MSEPSGSTPSTPEHAAKVPYPTVRRSHTVPTRFADPVRTAPSAVPGPDSVETLFVHPQAKIVSFTIPKVPSRPSSSSGTAASEAGALSWTSPTERTLATGPLNIYRVPNTGVSFINSGSSFLYHVMQKSQCWCVDEGSKFVLRVREGTFYRIELSASTFEEKQKIEEFKAVLSKILQYEKTPSPFTRRYVEEPEAPQTPVPRKSTQPRERAKKWRLNKVWEPEDEEHRARLRAKTQVSNLAQEQLGPRGTASPLSPDAAGSGESDRDGDSTEGDVGASGESSSTSDHETANNDQLDRSSVLPRPRPLPRPRSFHASRSITLPPHLTLHTSPPSQSTAMPPTLTNVDSDMVDNDAASVASSYDSFYSADEAAAASPHLDVSSREEEGDVTESLSTARHKRGTSESTAVPSTPKARIHGDESGESREQEPSDPATPPLISDSGDDTSDTAWFDAITPPDTMRLRHIARRPSSASLRPGFDAMANSTNLFTPRPPSRRTQLSHALIQKTYSLVIGPPAHLIALMLQIAARIVQGIPIVYDRSSARKKLPGTWESSAGEEDEWDEDDYGIPLKNLRRRPARSAERTGSDTRWGVD